jgi:hypothetical protein
VADVSCHGWFVGHADRSRGMPLCQGGVVRRQLVMPGRTTKGWVEYRNLQSEAAMGRRRARGCWLGEG